MSDKRTLALYQRYSTTGHRIENRAGVRASLKAGDDASSGEPVTWLVEAGTLGGLTPRAEYDLVRDLAGRWWVVKEVGPLTEGVYPLRCERWKGEE